MEYFCQQSYLNQHLKLESKNCKKQMDKMVSQSKKSKIKVTGYVDEERGSVVESASKYAEKNNIDLICVRSHSGLVESNIIGSIARQIVRNSEVPVWVLHD